MIIQENILLAQYTTFKIGGMARFFCVVKNTDELIEAVKFAKEKSVPFFILGGGSNILVSDNGFPGLVIKMEIKGKIINDAISNDQKEVQIITVGAGEVWDSFVDWTIKNGFNSLENLSAIPGTVGAAPVQNIGAYGVEVGQYVSLVHALDTQTMKEVEINGRDCHFGYRNSLFKHEKGRYIITSVDFLLKRDGKVNLEYKDLKEYFSKSQGTSKASDKVQEITPAQVRDAVINIRKNKLPDWTVWGTAGSFFKNPVVSAEKFAELKKMYPSLPGFPEKDLSGSPEGAQNGQMKIPLGWILDNVCHAKGVKNGAVGTYEKQALVIVTQLGAKAAEVVAFSQDLIKQVKEKTGIVVEAEVEWVN